MSNLPALEHKMRHRVARGTKQEWRGDAVYSTCERCNLEVHGYDDWDDDRGNIFIGWFHTVEGSNHGHTHCPDEFAPEEAKEWRAELARVFKK